MIQYGPYSFSDPIPFIWWIPPHLAGIYAVQVKGGAAAEQPWLPIYFGKTDDFFDRGLLRSHYAFQRWVRQAGSEDLLWISVHPEDDAFRRAVKEDALIQMYAPPCNVAHSQPGILSAHDQ